MIITKKWLQENGACADGSEWLMMQKKRALLPVLLSLVDDGHKEWAFWVLQKILIREDSVRVAIFAARYCLDIFEHLYPVDDRPRKALEAAEMYVLTPTKKNARAAYAAASSASIASVHASSASAAYSTTSAAYAAASSAAYAASSAACAAYSTLSSVYSPTYAYSAAYAAYAASAHGVLYRKIMIYAVTLVKGGR